jgi:hypothetical protein
VWLNLLFRSGHSVLVTRVMLYDDSMCVVFRNSGRHQMADKSLRRLSLSSMRDNFVRHALSTGTCLLCSQRIEVKPCVSCTCGFTVDVDEMARHENATGNTVSENGREDRFNSQ